MEILLAQNSKVFFQVILVLFSKLFVSDQILLYFYLETKQTQNTCPSPFQIPLFSLLFWCFSFSLLNNRKLYLRHIGNTKAQVCIRHLEMLILCMAGQGMAVQNQCEIRV